MRLRTILIVFLCFAAVGALLIGFRLGYGTKAYHEFQTTFKDLFATGGQTSVKRPAKRDPLIEQNLVARLKQLESTDAEIRSQLFLEDTTLEIHASVPRGKPIEWIIWFLSSAADGTGYQVSESVCAPDYKTCRIYFKPGRSGMPIVKLSLQRSSRYFSRTARMAILIQDFGFEANQTTVEFLSFPEPLTISLVPAKRLSSWTAQIADEYHKEIVVLLPMEPVPSSSAKYDNTIIMLHYPEEKIRSIVTKAVESIPNFAGFGNLFGARATEDSRVMSIVLEELRKRHGYFIGTALTRKTVLPALARKMKVPYESVESVLNTDISSDRIQDTIRHYAILAQKKGKVLISGKPTASFIKALREELPILKQNGIRLVYVSEVVKHPDEE